MRPALGYGNPRPNYDEHQQGSEWEPGFLPPGWISATRPGDEESENLESDDAENEGGRSASRSHGRIVRLVGAIVDARVGERSGRIGERRPQRRAAKFAALKGQSVSLHSKW